ncbi:hypothetical protein [Streptosporangium subroseum]|uniref:hypothetical protein n=1 Tax=Streptosporangium subroseum TaxID=106412 RepID=UPI00308833D7|nr:hypothetical protein OHB15_14020 [Streptosporangium subroseum]
MELSHDLKMSLFLAVGARITQFENQVGTDSYSQHELANCRELHQALRSALTVSIESYGLSIAA